MRRMPVAALAVAAVAAGLAAGCSGGGRGADKAGGSRSPVVLRMADGYNPGLELEPAVAYFVRRVRQLSKGEVRIRVVEAWADESPRFEQRIVRDVASGKADLGWVGTRVFDTLGVRSFQALTAPMLIDSYPLERAVVTGDLPKRMLDGLEPLGVSGLGVLAGGLRRPIALRRPLLRASQWRGVRFAVFHSHGQEQAVRALGGRPTNVWGSALQDAVATARVDGFEKNYALWSLVIDPSAVPYVTANVALWPETAALLANPRRLDGLDDEQRGWLRQAAADAAARSTSLFEHEAPLVRYLCKQGARFANASAADLASLRQAFRPVYATLDQDAATAEFVSAIRDLKRGLPAAPDATIPAGCAGSADRVAAAVASSASPPILNGVYRVSWSRRELLAAGPLARYARTSYGVVTLTLRNGRFRFRPQSPPECTGEYTASRDRIRLRMRPVSYCQGIVTASWRLRDGLLRLRVLATTNPGDSLVWGGKPWRKIG